MAGRSLKVEAPAKLNRFLAVLGRRVFAQAQHVLRRHAGLAGALDGFADRLQAAHQAGLQLAQALQLVGRAVQRHRHFLAEMAHDVGPVQLLGLGGGCGVGGGRGVAGPDVFGVRALPDTLG